MLYNNYSGLGASSAFSLTSMLSACLVRQALLRVQSPFKIGLDVINVLVSNGNLNGKEEGGREEETREEERNAKSH